jgi:hypothetical protein
MPCEQVVALDLQPGQAFLDQAEEFARAVGWHPGRGRPFDEHEQAGAGLLAAADQFLSLSEQSRAKSGWWGEVHGDDQK